MKAEMIKSVGNVVTNTLKSSAKAEKAVASKAVKNGETLLATAQDAKAAQGKAMINYQKPQMNEVKLDKQDLKAASGWDDGGYNPRGGRSGGWDEFAW